MVEPDTAFAYVVGSRCNPSEIELDPVLAWHRGRALDAQLRAAMPPHPRGVFRGSFEDFARMASERALAAARRVEGG